MAERTLNGLQVQADMALSEGDPKRQISETRRLENGITVRISGLAMQYHPAEVPGTVGAIDPQTGRPKYSF